MEFKTKATGVVDKIGLYDGTKVVFDAFDDANMGRLHRVNETF